MRAPRETTPAQPQIGPEEAVESDLRHLEALAVQGHTDLTKDAQK